MINTENIGGLIGSNVIGSDGDKIGSVGQVYVDPDTGRPNWITVRTGLFGLRESFVPLDAAEQSGDDIRVPYSKDFVKDAPNIDHEGALEEDETDNLYSYYGGGTAGYSTGTTGGYRTGDDTPGTAGYTAAATGPAGTGATTGTPGTTATGGVSGAAGTSGTDDYDTGRRTEGYDTGRRTEGYDTSGPTTDDAMTRSEERLHVGTEKVQTGRARLRKYVVTEQQNVTVPVTREEVRVEREPITDANVGNAMSGPDISEEEHEVVLTEERPVVEKETVPVERVRLDKETVTENETVTGEVRKEEIEIEGDSTTRDR
ncbi:DUF2382 domain-containing protein [Microbacterium sp. DT81.1]|uniref:DUF2382 domain-containing protein n=1 Tax=Microbacterium sp. DT81.1 TaxID=3393413 RepID=UPI003CF6CC88